MGLRSDIERAARHAAAGCDVEPLLDAAAARALVALYPDEVPDLANLYERRRSHRGYAEHVVDAIVLAVAEEDERRDVLANDGAAQ